jgi:putative transposase
MVRENPTWGQMRVAAELSLKLGISVSSRTVRNYWPENLQPSSGASGQRWATFIKKHAKAIVACDFVVSVTARFRILYVFVLMEVGSRKLLHVNATLHPTSSWTLQQLREAIPSDHGYRWLIHDRSGIFSTELDRSVDALGVAILKSPVRAPKANVYCERLIGSLRRECLGAKRTNRMTLRLKIICRRDCTAALRQNYIRALTGPQCKCDTQNPTLDFGSLTSVLLTAADASTPCA